MKKLVLAIGLVIASSVNVFSQDNSIKNCSAEYINIIKNYQGSGVPFNLIEKYNLNYMYLNARTAVYTNNFELVNYQEPSFIENLKLEYKKFIELDDNQHDIIPDTTKNLGSLYEYVSNIPETFGVWELKELFKNLEMNNSKLNDHILQIFHYDINDDKIEYLDIFEIYTYKIKTIQTITLVKYKNGDLKLWEFEVE